MEELDACLVRLCQSVRLKFTSQLCWRVSQVQTREEESDADSVRSGQPVCINSRQSCAHGSYLRRDCSGWVGCSFRRIAPTCNE
jgi:hypothetical protein